MKKVLLVEDNEILRENTAEILELANYQVYTCENGKTGVETALKEVPDLIICDIMMPVLDGFGVLHLLQKNPSTQNIPFIFLTARTEHTDFRKGMESGADDYITKPFTGIELLKAVESRIKKADFLKEKLSSGLQGLQELMKAGSPNDLKDLTKDCTNNMYHNKQTVYSEGNRPQSLFYVQKGKIKTYKTNDFGKGLAVGLYTTGDFFGYVALLEGTNYHETAVAMEESEVAIIPIEDFELLINNNQAVSKKFIQLLAKNISEMEEQLLGMAYNSLRKKVATALVTLYNKYNTNEDADFPIDISRDSLASVAGTATESLIRTLSDFKNEKLIKINESVITIVNKRKLENLLN